METKTTATEVLDDEHKRDARGRRIAERQRKAEIVDGYTSSGLTQKTYAQREGVNYHTFVSWLSQSRGRSSVPSPRGKTEIEAGAARAPGFVQMTWPAMPAATPSSSRLEVVLADGVTVRGDDPAAMVLLLRALVPTRTC